MSDSKQSYQSGIASLPIAKHLPNLSEQVDNFRKGEKSLFWFVKLAALFGGGYALWVYVITPILIALGQALAIVATGIAIVGAILLAPLILKGLRFIVREIHKGFVRFRPFDTLADERVKMIDNQTQFRIAKQSIMNLRQEMEVEAENSQKDGETAQRKILTLRGKAEAMTNELAEMVKTKGVSIKGEDEYVNKKAELQKVLAEANRVENKYNHSKDYVQKYGSRANIMKKMTHKLTMVETVMEIKIQDFDASVEMLKKDYEFGQKSNAATTAAKSVLGFTKGWELELALETVAINIAQDVAISAGNIRDIESITSNYTLDSDELYANLNLVADNIKIGADIVPDAHQYSNIEYELTQSDKNKSGGFGDMF